MNPGPAPALQPLPRRRRSHKTPGLCPGSFKEKKEDAIEPPDQLNTD